MSRAGISLRLADWSLEKTALLLIRERVFVQEQGVPAEMELDQWDAESTHFLGLAGTQPIATARLLPIGKIGRLAVLPEWRGQGIGRDLMLLALDTARRRGLAAIVIHAQASVVEFYRKLGFVAHGGIFDEAGIPHREMRLGL
jgi:predicted GNAT family N-acyltransferase